MLATGIPLRAEQKNRMPVFFASPTSGAARLSVTFFYREGLRSSNETANGAYTLDFGDGLQVNKDIRQHGCDGTDLNGDCAYPLTTHTYAKPGTFTATLSTCDPKTDLYCDTLKIGTAIIKVTGSNVVSTILSSSLTSGQAPLSVHFSMTDKFRGDKDGTYAIDYGDSNGNWTEIKPQCSENACTISIDHKYIFSGAFTPTLYWTAGCHAPAGGDCALVSDDIASAKVTVSGGPAEAKLSASPLSGGESVDVTFNIKGIGGPFVLDFGDSGNDTDRFGIGYLLNSDPVSTTHIYKVSFGLTDSGTYTYTAKLMSNGTVIDTAKITVQQNSCQQATTKFLKGGITPQAWHTACGTSAIYNGK